MKSTDLEKELLRGKDLFGEIVRIASDFLQRFDELEGSEISAFEVKRQELTEELRIFCSGLKRKLGDEKDIPLAMKKQIDAFRIFQEGFARIIMGTDAAIISRATETMERLQDRKSVV